MSLIFQMVCSCFLLLPLSGRTRTSGLTHPKDHHRENDANTLIIHAILVDIILVHLKPYECSYLKSLSCKENGQYWLTLKPLPVSRPPCFIQTSVSLLYLTIDVSFRSCTVHLVGGPLSWSLIQLFISSYAATILTKCFGVWTGFAIFRDSQFGWHSHFCH